MVTSSMKLCTTLNTSCWVNPVSLLIRITRSRFVIVAMDSVVEFLCALLIWEKSTIWQSFFVERSLHRGYENVLLRTTQPIKGRQ